MAEEKAQARSIPARILEVAAPPAAQDIRDAIVIKDDDLFLLTDLEGNVPPGNTNGFGLYYQDTRFLSGYQLEVQGLRPTILVSHVRPPAFQAQVLTNPNLLTSEGQLIHEQTVQIRRYRVLQPLGVSESLTFENLNTIPLTLVIGLQFAADFSDIFQVRGLVREVPRGRLHSIEYRDGRMTFRYDGRDGIRRLTTVRFDPPPAQVVAGSASYEMELTARGEQRIAITVELRQEPGLDKRAKHAVPGTRTRARRGAYRRWPSEHAVVETSNTLFNAILKQAREDLRVLMSGQEDMPYPAAGIPWYATLFGRDSIITALQEMWIAPSRAKHTLRLLARVQGERDDPWRDEEPGKIMHELRRGELANIGLVPFALYYGTIDATPLWVVLLAQYYRATADLELLRELLPNLEAALNWIDRHGDIDGDGFVEYRPRSRSGLVNQGWKDSWDGIVHADGSLPEAPIAVVEVQAYVYAARLGAAYLFRALGEHGRAVQLEAEAERLRETFEAAFWMPDVAYYCLALDGHKRQVTAISSNPGHALWCGIVSRERAEQVAARLMAKDLFSGWGVRTLSSREVRYNPAGYHVGTVWPHDNSLIALGLKRYGQETRALEIASGLYDAATHFPFFRMPELFCGFARAAFGIPVRYPVACSPQAWAAASWSALLQAMLGIRLDAPAREVHIIRPRLPEWIQWVRVSRVAVPGGEVDLRYERIEDHTAVDVAALRGDVRVMFIDQWEQEKR